MASVVAGLRFKTIAVTKRCSIKAFVEEKSLTFKKGRGFYQLTKPEVIQDYKEVIVRRKSDGKIVTGDQVREILAIPKSSKKFQLDLVTITDFDVFVQSTSVNRVLLPHTDFLYEAEEATVSFGLCTGRFSTAELILSSFCTYGHTDTIVTPMVWLGQRPRTTSMTAHASNISRLPSCFLLSLPFLFRIPSLSSPLFLFHFCIVYGKGCVNPFLSIWLSYWSMSV